MRGIAIFLFMFFFFNINACIINFFFYNGYYFLNFIFYIPCFNFLLIYLNFFLIIYFLEFFYNYFFIYSYIFYFKPVKKNFLFFFMDMILDKKYIFIYNFFCYPLNKIIKNIDIFYCQLCFNKNINCYYGYNFFSCVHKYFMFFEKTNYYITFFFFYNFIFFYNFCNAYTRKAYLHYFYNTFFINIQNKEKNNFLFLYKYYCNNYNVITNYKFIFYYITNITNYVFIDYFYLYNFLFFWEDDFIYVIDIYDQINFCFPENMINMLTIFYYEYYNYYDFYVDSYYF